MWVLYVYVSGLIVKVDVQCIEFLKELPGIREKCMRTENSNAQFNIPKNILFCLQKFLMAFLTSCQWKGRLSKHVWLSTSWIIVSFSLGWGYNFHYFPGGMAIALPNRLNSGEVTLTKAQRFIGLQIALTLVDGSVCWRIGKQDSTNTGMAR